MPQIFYIASNTKAQCLISFFKLVIKGYSWLNKLFLVFLSILANFKLLCNKTAIFKAL